MKAQQNKTGGIMENTQNICVMGLGYIGLPTASLLATQGNTVVGVDVKPEVIDTINEGRIHIVEPDLDEQVRTAVSSGNLRAALTPSPADVFIIAVPTPFKEDHAPDLSYIEAATRAIAPVIALDNLVVLESTSPVGTTEKIAEILRQERPDLCDGDDLRLFVAHCPERVLPGHIIREIVENDRIVGGITPRSTEVAAAFYRSFVYGTVLTTDSRTAEMAKLTENAYRDTNIAFANELSIVCARLGVDVWQLIKLANHHPRVDILQPGPGVGGHCLAVDPWFLISAAPEDTQLIRAARTINDGKIDWVVQRVIDRAQRLKDPIIGCMGLAYKPNIDDLRESPALAVTQRLMTALPNATILPCEPNLKSYDAFPIYPMHDVLKRADIIVGLVAHRSFRYLPRIHLEGKMVIDTCGVFL